MRQVQVLIDNRIRIPLSQLSVALVLKVQRQFTYDNPEYRKLKAIRGFVPRGVPETLRSWELSTCELSVPRGALDKLRDVLGALRVRRAKCMGRPLASPLPEHRIRLRPYQEEIKRVCTHELGLSGTALIRSPQGSGKTTTGFAIASEINLATLVVVPTERIFKQWVDGALKNLGLEADEVGIIRGNKRVIRPLTIGMQQTLRNCAHEYADVFGLVIGDEAQRFAASTFFDVIDVLKAVYRVGLTADERRSDKKEFLVHDVFGPVLLEVSRETLIAQGAIIDAEIRVVPTEFDAPWYTELAPLKRAQSHNQQRLTVELEGNKARNALVMEVLGWCVEEGEPTITLAWHREHCATLNSMSLARGWDSGLLLGGAESRDEFDRTERELRECSLNQAVGTYQAIGVGFDLPLVSRGIFAAPCAGKSGKQQFAQFTGRYERPSPETGKVEQDAVIVYYFWDRKVFGLWPLIHISRWKPKVKVLDGEHWVNAKQFIREEEQREDDKNRQDDEQLGFLRARG